MENLTSNKSNKTIKHFFLNLLCNVQCPALLIAMSVGIIEEVSTSSIGYSVGLLFYSSNNINVVGALSQWYARPGLPRDLPALHQMNFMRDLSLDFRQFYVLTEFFIKCFNFGPYE